MTEQQQSASSCIPCHMSTTVVYLFGCISLFSGTMKCSRLILYISCPPPPKICHLSKGPLFVFFEEQYKKQDLSTRYWSVIVSRSSQLMEQEDICVYTNHYVYVNLQTFLYVVIYILS